MKHIALLLSFLLSLGASAEVRVAGIFSDGMVLQRDRKLPVWGTGQVGEQVTVSLDGKEAKTTVLTDGTWRVELPKHQAGGPYVLRVNDREIRDVLVGDVFLCTGQSNMELMVNRCMDRVADKVRDYSNSQVRYVKIPHQFNYVAPNADLNTLGWQAITPQTAQGMGAVAYFAGRYLQEAEGVPIGLINSSVGGTGVECWMSRDTLLHHAEWVQPLQDRKFSQLDWVDSVRRAEMLRGMEWEQSLLQNDPVNHQSVQGTPVDIFSRWASGQQGRIYGSYWFRNTFDINTQFAQDQTYTIRLGAMKDADSVWVNGHFVGTTSYEYPPRIYKVPGNILHPGQNEVVIKLMAQGGYPKFTSGKLYQMELGDQVIPLQEGWSLQRGAELAAKPGSTYFVNTPTGLYNAMIAPLRDLPISGAVWYQGENNTNMSRAQYASLAESMIRCWRNQFGTDFPIVMVQLAGYMSQHAEPLQQSGWCDVRLAQDDAAQRLSHGGMATAIDLGESNDIHPQRKDELGRRVALQWRRLVYGEKSLVAEGPRPVSASLKGDQVVVRFSKKTGKLAAAEHLAGFSLAGEDGRYQWVEARITAPYALSLTIPEGMQPRTLRYAYDDYPVVTLYNTKGLPSGTFQILVKN